MCPKWVFATIALFLVSMVITYHIKFIRKATNRHNILVSLLLLVAETIRIALIIYFANYFPLTEIFQITFLFELLSTDLFLVLLRIFRRDVNITPLFSVQKFEKVAVNNEIQYDKM